MSITDKEIKEVYVMLKTRFIKPQGTWDSQGRFYAKNKDLIDVRSPSRDWPYSEWNACHTLKYVKKVCEKFNPKDQGELINLL